MPFSPSMIRFAMALCAPMVFLATSCFADPYLLVNGTNSQNVVRFDLSTGAASLFAQYQAGANPNNLAMDSAGQLYASLAGANKNVVKLVSQPGSSVLTTANFTASIGGFGPSDLEFYKGNLYVAGNASRAILEYNGTTGALVDQFSSSTSFNICALDIYNDDLLYQEVFQNRVRSFDLTQNPPAGHTVFQDPNSNVEKCLGMTVGWQLNLVFADANNSLVQAYAPNGAYLGPLADVKSFDSSLTGSFDVVFSPELDNYFVSAGNKVFRLSTNGALLQTYQSQLLSGATGLLIVPEPSSFILSAFALVGIMCCRFARRRSDVGQGSP